MCRQDYKKKCIRSLRVARELMRRGFLPMDVEVARKSHGYLVFIFRETAELIVHFENITQEIACKRVDNTQIYQNTTNK